MTRVAYTFDNSDTAALDQFASLETCLDPITIDRLEALDLQRGARCWEIGAGGGSIAAWLATRAGPAGHVVATDIDTTRLDHLQPLGNVAVVEHDISTLTPPDDDGAFALIHARLVLLHLPRRREILPMLASHLQPGGWLLIEEFGGTVGLRVYRGPSEADAELFAKVTAAIIAILETNGADLAWAHQVHAAMADAGLVDIHTISRSESWSGASPGARLHATNTRQLAGQLESRGITATELDRFRTLMVDPAHAAASYTLVSTRGRRPAHQPPRRAMRSLSS